MAFCMLVWLNNGRQAEHVERIYVEGGMEWRRGSMHAALGIFETRYHSGGRPLGQPQDQAGIIESTLQ